MPANTRMQPDPLEGGTDGTGMTIAIRPLPAQSTAHQRIPTPSRAEHGPGRRFTFFEASKRSRGSSIAQICIFRKLLSHEKRIMQ